MKTIIICHFFIITKGSRARNLTIIQCVSGGSHPGLMHICQMGEYFYVSAFVRDHGLTATMYQDYGWPAKELICLVTGYGES